MRTRDVAKKLGLNNPIIIDYGPGGAVDFLLDWLPKGERANWGAWEKVQRIMVRALENMLRKTDLFYLETSEPEEIANLFKDLSPERMYVVDIEQKVIQAVQKMADRTGLQLPISYHILDIQNHRFQHQGDIVIAYYIIQRTGNPEQSLDNIAGSTRIGGLLSSNIGFCPQGFIQKEEGVYQRIL